MKMGGRTRPLGATKKKNQGAPGSGGIGVGGRSPNEDRFGFWGKTLGGGTKTSGAAAPRGGG